MLVCLDTFALISWLQGEKGADAVTGMLADAGPRDGCLMSSLNLGETYYILARRAGVVEADRLWRSCVTGEIPIRLVETTTSRIRAAARVKAAHAISFADAFAVATALEHGCPLVSGDPEIAAMHQAVGLQLITV
jgi:ribonuclease VapC